jgi:Outer membrane protein beta-barrel domain
LRKLVFVATVFFLLLSFFVIPNLASAQQGDAMLGFGTVVSPSAPSCGSSTSGVFTCPEDGGLYINLGADVIFHRRMGFGFDAAWKASQGAYGGTGGQPFRPILFDFNGVYQPRLSKKVGADLMAGIGWQTTRFYLPFCTGTFSCTNYTSSNHFLVDLGAGVRYYVWGNAFVRPEVRYYRIFNNTNDFSSDNIIRVGASIGYTIGGPQ